MDLVFSPAGFCAIIASTLIVSQIATAGESNWLEGDLLPVPYALLGPLFYFVPEVLPFLEGIHN